jgi:multisubunit Na+/H+ antiporter MnhC subunit
MCIIGKFLIYSIYLSLIIILLLLLTYAVLLMIYLIYLKRINYENLLSNDKA